MKKSLLVIAVVVAMMAIMTGWTYIASIRSDADFKISVPASNKAFMPDFANTAGVKTAMYEIVGTTATKTDGVNVTITGKPFSAYNSYNVLCTYANLTSTVDGVPIVVSRVSSSVFRISGKTGETVYYRALGF